MLRTRATARCSTAPAEALQTTGVTSAERRSGITTPAAPPDSATRQTAPRLPGSLRGVPHVPAKLGELIPPRVGRGEVARRPCVLALAQKPLGLRIGRLVHLGEEVLETERVEHLLEPAGADRLAGVDAAIGLR